MTICRITRTRTQRVPWNCVHFVRLLALLSARVVLCLIYKALILRSAPYQLPPHESPPPNPSPPPHHHQAQCLTSRGSWQHPISRTRTMTAIGWMLTTTLRPSLSQYPSTRSKKPFIRFKRPLLAYATSKQIGPPILRSPAARFPSSTAARLQLINKRTKTRTWRP